MFHFIRSLPARIVYAGVWLSRIGRGRGYGVQSPTDYRFVRDVIGETWPYYAYERLQPDDDWLSQKMGRLFFRVSNWRQPATFFATAFQSYIQQGCLKAQALTSLTPAAEMVLLTAADGAALDTLLQSPPADTILVIDRRAGGDALWQKAVAHPAATITYDLYYCGVALFLPKRHRHHYRIIF